MPKQCSTRAITKGKHKIGKCHIGRAVNLQNECRLEYSAILNAVHLRNGRISLSFKKLKL